MPSAFSPLLRARDTDSNDLPSDLQPVLKSNDIPHDLEPVSPNSNTVPAGYVLDRPGENAVPDDLVPVHPSMVDRIVPQQGQAHWTTLASNEIQRRGLNLTNGADISEAHAIADAYRTQYGPDADKSQPSYSQELEAARQTGVQADNAQRGVVASNVIELLHPSAGLFARGERLLSGPVGMVSPSAAQNMQFNAQSLEETKGNGGASSLPGQLLGNLPVLANPFVAAASGMNEAYTGDESAKDAGQQISTANEVADVAGTGAINAFTSKIFAGKVGSSSVAARAEQSIQKYVAQYAPAYIAKYGAKAAVGALANDAGTVAENLLYGRPWHEGLGKSTALGAGLPVLHEAASGLVGAVRGTTEKTPATSSTASPVFDPDVADRLAKANDLPADFAAAPEPPAPLPETGPSMAEDFPTILSDEEAAQIRNENAFRKEFGEFNFENPTDDEMAAADARIKGIDSRMGSVDRRVSVDTNTAESTPQDFGYEFKSPSEVAQEKPSFPDEHPDARSTAEWASQFDPDTKEVGDTRTKTVTSDYFEGELKKLKGGDGKFVLADVPTDAITPNDSYQPKQEQAYSQLPLDSRPPGLMGFDKDSGEGVVVDGNTRLRAAIANGEKTVRAYVPEESIGTKGIARVGDEATGSISDNRTPFQRRTVGSDITLGVQNTIGSIKTAWTNANRLLGTGLGVSDGEAGVRSRLIATGSETDLARTNLEQALKPARDYADTLSDSDRAKWTDAIEKGQSSPDPKLQPAADLIRNVNKLLKAQADKVGIDTDNWNGDWIGRLAEWPDSGKGRGTSISGPETYLKGRKLDSFSDFKAAVEKTGGRLKYDNPVDMYLAKAAEVHRSVAGRQFLNNEEGLGTVKTFDTVNTIPDGWKPIDDKLARGKTRLWIQENADTGEPQARMKPGTIKAAPAPIADLLNQFIAPGVQSGSILDQISKVTRAATAVNFSLSAFHAATTAYSNAYLGIRQAMDNVLNGEFSSAVKNTGRALNPVSAFKLGSAVREQLADVNSHPELEPLANAIRVSGAKSGTPTILERSDWQQAVNAYRQGDRPTAGFRFGKAALGAMSDTIMHKLVPNMKVAALSMAAETATKRGLQGPELAKYMQEASRLTDNTAGQVIRSNQFQHRVVQNVMDLVMTAPKFAEGAVRIYGGAAVDSLKGLADVAQGKALRITGNQQMVLAHLLVHGLASAATQAIVTAVTTGKPIVPTSFKDMWYPQTGRKNVDGSEERLTLPDPLGGVASAVTEGPVSAIKNRINPLWKALSDVALNSDYRNVQVREGNVAQQIGQSAKHIGAAVLPWSVQQASQPDNPNQPKVTPAQRAAAFAGVRVASPRISDTPAQRLASQLIANHYEVGSRTQEEAAKSDEVRKVANNIRIRQPGAVQDLGRDVRSGKLNPEDVKKVVNRAEAPEGLTGTLKNSKLNPDEIMQVWDKASLDEKKTIRLVVQKRVAGSGELSVEQKRTYLQKIFSDVRPQGS